MLRTIKRIEKIHVEQEQERRNRSTAWGRWYNVNRWRRVRTTELLYCFSFSIKEKYSKLKGA